MNRSKLCGSKKVADLCVNKAIGLDIVAVIVAETNGFTLFKNAPQLVSYSGYGIVENQSGNQMIPNFLPPFLAETPNISGTRDCPISMSFKILNFLFMLFCCFQQKIAEKTANIAGASLL